MSELNGRTLPECHPCSACGCADPKLEEMTPIGHLKPVWRVLCSCGQGPQQWSVTPEAAVRLWNRTAGLKGEGK